MKTESTRKQVCLLSMEEREVCCRGAKSFLLEGKSWTELMLLFPCALSFSALSITLRCKTWNQLPCQGTHRIGAREAREAEPTNLSSGKCRKDWKEGKKRKDQEGADRNSNSSKEWERKEEEKNDTNTSLDWNYTHQEENTFQKETECVCCQCFREWIESNCLWVVTEGRRRRKVYRIEEKV